MIAMEGLIWISTVGDPSSTLFEIIAKIAKLDSQMFQTSRLKSILLGSKTNLTRSREDQL